MLVPNKDGKPCDFGVISVGIKVEKQIWIKNTGRHMAVYHLKKYPEQLEISPLADKLSADQKNCIRVVLTAKEETEIDDTIKIRIRGGGEPMIIPVQAKVIIPDVYIQEDSVEFGGITQGNTATETFTLCNDSPIGINLYLDLREHTELEISIEDPE